MIIHPVQREQTADSYTLSTKIEWETKATDNPESLWYTFPSKYESVISENYDGFLVPLVAVAMFHKENIKVCGPVSKELLYSLDTYQQILNFWHPEFFSVIQITADSVAEASSCAATKGTMCTYTGGIDSSYTLWSHLPANETDVNYNITHALYVTDLGLHLENQETVAAKVTSFTDLTDSLGIEFVPVETNAKLFHQYGDQTPMYMSEGALILGPVAFFEQVVSNFLYSSDETHDGEIFEVINHTLVPLLGTSNMNVRVHAASVSRLEKLSALATWPATHNRLVVCWKNPDQLNNCDTCNKCCYTMAGIQIQNLTGVFKTFPEKVPRSNYRACRSEKGFTLIFEKLIYHAKKNKQWAIAVDYTWALWVSRLHIWLEDVRLSSLRQPVTIMYIVSGALRQKSTIYGRLLDKVKGVKNVQA